MADRYDDIPPERDEGARQGASVLRSLIYIIPSLIALFIIYLVLRNFGIV